MDRFFAELRRRHPDVEVVRMPPQPPPEDRDPEADRALIEDLARIVVRRPR